MTYNSHNLANRWARAGAFFNASQKADSPDLEQLLLDTVRFSPDDNRLFIMAASWLAQNHQFISIEKLTRLIEDELEEEFLPIMGMLLDNARAFSHTKRLDSAIAICKPAAEAHPLSRLEQSSPTLRKISERNSSDISKRWNRWTTPFTLKKNAIRSHQWIASNNPAFQLQTA